MTSLRRTVQAWMKDTLYRKLGNEPNIELTWKLLRDFIGEQLFGTEFVTIPYIESAIYFNQLFVFTKKQDIWSRLGLRPPVYKIEGNLDYLVNRDVSTWMPQFDFSPWDVADGLNMYQEFKLRINSSRTDLDKFIELIVIEPHARSATPPMPTSSLTIHTNLLPGLCGVNILYVITDVVFASYIKLHVQIGAQQKVKIYDRDTPIGFKYRKYKLGSDGTFIAELHTMMRFTSRDVTWIRPTPQPVPSIPRWDPMSRRFIGSGGRRKMRNNLTIPSQEEPTRPSRRRTWMQDGGVVRRDRPQINGAVLHARDALDVNDDAVDQDDGWRNVLFQRQVFQNQHNHHRHNRLSVSLDNLPVND